MRACCPQMEGNLGPLMYVPTHEVGGKTRASIIFTRWTRG